MRRNSLPSVKRLRALVLGIFLVVPFQANAQESAQSVIQALQSKVATLRTLQGTLTITGKFAKPSKKMEEFEASGMLQTQVPDLFRLDLKANVKDPDRGAPMKFSAQILLDGKMLWVNVTNAAGKPSFLSSFDFAKLKQEFPDIFLMRDVEGYFNPADALNEINFNTVKLEGRSTLSGEPMVVLEGNLKHSLPMSLLSIGPEKSTTPAKVRIWVGTRDGVGYQVVMLDAKGKTIGSMRLSKVRLNQTLDPSTFVFSVPEGATPIDMTSLVEDEIHNKHQPSKK